MPFEITNGKQNKAIKTVIYGVEGIGKSSLAAKFPDPLFIDTEGSTSRMEVKRYPKPTSAQMLWDEITEIIKTKPCKTLVIDTFDWAERLIIQSICEASQKKSITSFGYGDGFVQLEEQVGRFLNLLSDVIDVANINVVITAHAKITSFSAPDADNSYDRYEMKLGNKTTAKTSNMLKEWADMVLFCNYQTFVIAKSEQNSKKHKATGGQRVMYTIHNPAWDAKNRFGLPEVLPLDFKSIAHLFSDNYEVKATEQIKEQQPQPIATNTVTTAQQTEPAEQPNSEVNNWTTNTDTHLSIDSTWKPTPYTDEEEAIMAELPKALTDLMKSKQVHPSEIQHAVSIKGYFTKDTPIKNYDPEFIQGCLIGAWPAVMELIQTDRDLPF